MIDREQIKSVIARLRESATFISDTLPPGVDKAGAYSSVRLAAAGLLEEQDTEIKRLEEQTKELRRQVLSLRALADIS